MTRFQTWIAALFLRHDYKNLVEFNTLDGEDFLEDYFQDFQNLYKREN